MKAVKETSTQLILKEYPSLLSPIFGILFIDLPLFLLYVILNEFGPQQMLCQRLEPQLVNCEYRTRKLLSWQVSTHQYKAVIAATHKVEESLTDGEKYVDHSVALTTEQGTFVILEGTFYLNGVRGNPQSAQWTAQRLSEFLQSADQSLVLNIPVTFSFSSVASIFLLGIFIAVGLVLMTSRLCIVTLRLDKPSQQVNYSRLSLLGLQKKSFAFHEIQSITVQETTDSDGDASFAAEMMTRSGQKYVLTYGNQRERVSQLTDRVRAFVGDRP